MAMNSRSRKKLSIAKKTSSVFCPIAKAIVKTTISHQPMRTREWTVSRRLRRTASVTCSMAQAPYAVPAAIKTVRPTSRMM